MLPAARQEEFGQDGVRVQIPAQLKQVCVKAHTKTLQQV